MIKCSAYEIVMIVHELHQRGYEQLRLCPGMSPSGMSWRWMVYPKVFVKDCRVERSHDAVPFNCPHGSTSELRPDDGRTKVTADDFQKAYGTCVSLAKGKDLEYVRWFETIVRHAQKNDFPIAFEEYYNAEQWKFMSGDPLPYPPFESVSSDRLSEDLIKDGYKPNVDEVERYIDKWNDDKQNTDNDEALYKLFNELCPENKDIRDILIKCSALNEFYSTNVYHIYEVAQHIKKLNVDEKLQTGDLSIVNKIAYVKTENRKYYSFATKYCSFHKPDMYPIFDSYVERLLREFQKRDQFSEFKMSELRDYPIFKKAIDDFRTYYCLDFTYKELDQYLWQFGKDLFG